MVRHFLERDKKDSDGTYHAAKLAWRALAYLQKLVERDRANEGKDNSQSKVSG
jgi:hypothetical protein